MMNATGSGHSDRRSPCWGVKADVCRVVVFNLRSSIPEVSPVSMCDQLASGEMIHLSSFDIGVGGQKLSGDVYELSGQSHGYGTG